MLSPSKQGVWLPLAVLSALGTVLVGACLRWALTGWALPVGQFSLWRSAHSHLGYYGLLFPLMWGAWRQLGQATPGRGWMWLYALAVGSSFVGFAKEGYGLPSIVASTVVLVVWLVSAWQVRRGQGWMASVGGSILLGAVCIPPVAVLTGRDPALAQAVVQGFLSVLLLGAVLPSVLQLRGMPRARPWLWFLGAALTGAFFGPVPHPLLGAGPVLLAWLLSRSAWSAPVGWATRMGWLALSVALLFLGAGLLPSTRAVMIGGFHFLVLGPVLWQLTVGLWTRRPPQWVEALYLLVMATMGGSVLLQHWVPGQGMMQAAAWSGALAAAVVGLGACWLLGQWVAGRIGPDPLGHSTQP